MKYFCKSDERKGTCYYVFQKGGFNEKFWLEDSLLIHDDVWYDSGLEDFFFAEVEELEAYGTTEINRSMWENILKRADDYDEITREAIGELSEWVEENFKENEVFTILGL